MKHDMQFQILPQIANTSALTLTAKITDGNLSTYPEGVFHRPTSAEGNRGWGFSRFKKHLEIENAGYLRNDTLYIRTCIDACSNRDNNNID